MKVITEKNDLTRVKADLLVVNICQGEKKPSGATAAVDKALGGLLTAEIKDTWFAGKRGEMLAVSAHGKISAKRVVLVGLGEYKKLDRETLRRVSAAIIRAYQGKGIRRIATIFHGAGQGKIAPRDAAASIAAGALLAAYRFHKYQEKKKDANEIEELVIVDRDARKLRQAEQGIAAARLAVEATVYARDLVNEPASVCIPAHLVKHARDIAKASKGAVTVEIFDRNECKRLGMGAFLSVASGAGEEPFFIHLKFKPRGAKKKIALVGKGITFDSGGLQIKPGDAMQGMKLDMAGAAAVLGVFSKITELAPRAEVHGIIAATENMPGPRAYKPGDIVRAMNGKTIEIGHTDAEGRVTLADALAYAAKLKPDEIIELATLTGAAMVALGEEVAAVMGNDEKLIGRIRAAAEQTGEQFWQLPLHEDYRGLIKSHVADIKNSSSVRYGGAITGGLFLSNFVNDIPWAHLDIAGPAFAEKDTISYLPRGGTGFGVRTLIEFLHS